jgi:hypothetical protein
LTRDRGDQVTAVIRPRDGGPEQTVIADYLVAAEAAPQLTPVLAALLSRPAP